MAPYGRALYSTHVVMRERYCANLVSLALCACQAADHPVERHDLLNRQASVDGRKNALRIIGIKPMIGLHGDDVRTQLARLARKRAGLDAERLGGVAGRDRNGGIGSWAVNLEVRYFLRFPSDNRPLMSIPPAASGVHRCSNPEGMTGKCSQSNAPIAASRLLPTKRAAEN